MTMRDRLGEFSAPAHGRRWQLPCDRRDAAAVVAWLAFAAIIFYVAALAVKAI